MVVVVRIVVVVAQWSAWPWFSSLISRFVRGGLADQNPSVSTQSSFHSSLFDFLDSRFDSFNSWFASFLLIFFACAIALISWGLTFSSFSSFSPLPVVIPESDLTRVGIAPGLESRVASPPVLLHRLPSGCHPS